MSGFIRRFPFFPGTEVITAIEGVIIVDLPPPGAVQGVGTGVACIVGEFADCSTAVSIDTSGTVTTKSSPTSITSTADLLNNLGGFDETIGEFGGSQGNGFVELRNKTFASLVAQAVNLASNRGGRVWRQLPTNKSATSPLPIVPMQAATVAAGREFKNGNDKIRLAAKASFTAEDAYDSGTDGTVVNAVAAATAPLTSATGAFTTVRNLRNTANLNVGVQVGDLLAMGVIGAAGAQGSNADTYRVVSVDSSTQVTLEKLDGSNFSFASSSVMAWRIHDAHAGDSAATFGAYTGSAAGGYRIPLRPLTNGAGSSGSDGTFAASTVLTPTLAPPTADNVNWDPLSGLTLKLNPSGTTAFTSAVQRPNAPSSASLDALYSAAIDGLLGEDPPQRTINIVFSARSSTNTMAKLRAHVLAASAVGAGRRAVLSPPLSILSKATAEGDSAPGVGANRDERIDYSWPGARTFVPEAVGFTLSTPDGLTTTDGILDTFGSGWLAAVESNLPPERNPGQGAPPATDVLAPIVGLQRGVSGLTIGDYTNFRASGIAALRIDRVVGPVFQSGVTTSLISGEKNINRRRMADFIEDSVAQRVVQFAKLPLTNALKDGAAGECNAFLNELLSPNNPAAQRIVDFIVDTKSGNTPDLAAKNIFVIIIRVRTLPTADFIVTQHEIGEGVTIVR
jgi:hypothetical protein